MARRPGFEEGGSEYRDYCPKCGHLAYHWNEHKRKGYCHFCEYKSIKPKDNTEVVCLPYLIEKYYKKGIPIPELYPDAFECDESFRYLASRNVDIAPTWDINHAIKYDMENKKIYYPIYPVAKEYDKSWIYRHVYGTQYNTLIELEKKKAGYVFGLPYLYYYPTIVVVEGVFDVLSPGLDGYAIALLGTRMFESTAIWIKQNFKRAVIWLDPGAEQKAKVIANTLRDYGMETYWLKRHSEDEKHDPGECRCYKFIYDLKLFCKEGYSYGT